ncbi:S9 family peptidase [Bradyrhizobium jicamae]|uniref:S9 family peptidase n=1 Tax=Bradyrhizobium jicamae TaxID=280332 RepID=A0ABS5FUR6_9BRAD|nr:S9 family peptidase [Bradyrhizobium jicamae]MBR0800570.1 S9 family peptidase [Bradyrhizobium jicamae]
MHAPIDRRLLLSRAARLGLCLPFINLGDAAAGAQAPDLVARRVFFDNPDYLNVRLSPDGTHLSYIAPVDGVNNLWVAPIADLTAARPVTRATDRNISTYHRWGYTNRHLVFFRDHDGDENWRAASVDIVSGAIVPLTPEEGVSSSVQEADRKFPEEMLLRHNQRDKRYFDLFRVNIVTGKSELVYENSQYIGFVTDSAFQLRLAARIAADGTTEVFERKDGDWVAFATVPIADSDTTDLLDFSADGKTLYLIDSRGRDKAAFFALDMATRETTLLAADDDADISRAIFDEHRRPLAAMAMTDRARWHAVDPSVTRDLADLTRHGGGDITFVSNSDDLRFGTIYYERDTESGEYALLDRQTRDVHKLFIQRKSLGGVALHKLEPVVIPSRDGLRLNGYLTRPVEAEAGRVPLVLVIHGGPYMRDNWGFMSVHQWLASRGYAVLSVNYRGSTGFGKAFVTAADHEWGGKMHDDLIDAVDWAVAQGIADPKRVGFFGGSYGGYSALMAATKTPEVFACIVDLFGISNLVTFMASIPPYWGPWISIWKNRLGDPGTEAGRAFLVDRSPLTHIERATKPILIAQGMRDVRVVAAESEQMVAALKSRNVPVTYITFIDEGHGFVRPENRLACYGVTEAFLAKHLGGRCQPIGNDFAGSSLKIEVGGELVPGLRG